MICPFCAKNNYRTDVKHFDNSVAHLVINCDSTQNFHIHAPFEKPHMMVEMAKFLIIEMGKNGIQFTPDNVPIQNNPGD